ncbi:MAG: TlpA family protein disulfide reductase [Rickettsiaceae bacterium]|nr:TlpA family protein disulfide reductase [Rickettsiaceae bacterium]
MKNIVAIILSTLLIAFSAHSHDQSWKYEKYDAKLVPDEIPIFDNLGEKHFMEEYEGRTILLVFWASWCAPCVAEMTDLDLLQKDFRKLPFEVIAVSEDYLGVKVVEKFYAENEIRHLSIFHDYKNELFSAFGVVGMPTSFIITPDGKNVGMFKGVINWHNQDVRKILLSYIAGNPEEPKNSYKDNSLNQQILQKKQKEQKDENKNKP